MRLTRSNEGEVGVESIRINGMRIGDLPIGMGNQAKEWLPIAMDVERQNKIENILASYPRVTMAYLEARIRECKTAIKDFKRVRDETQEEIGRYRALIQQSEGRPSLRSIEPRIDEVANNDALSHEEKVAVIKQLKQDAAQWDIENLQVQIEQFEENIRRLDKAMDQEQDSLSDLYETKGKIMARDLELRALGVERIE